MTQTGQRLGMTCFRYVDEMREMVRQLVKDPALQSLWFAIWSQEHGFLGNDSNIAQVLGPLNVQDQGKRKDPRGHPTKLFLQVSHKIQNNMLSKHVVLYFWRCTVNLIFAISSITNEWFLSSLRQFY